MIYRIAIFNKKWFSECGGFTSPMFLLLYFIVHNSIINQGEGDRQRHLVFKRRFYCHTPSLQGTENPPPPQAGCHCWEYNKLSHSTLPKISREPSFQMQGDLSSCDFIFHLFNSLELLNIPLAVIVSLFPSYVGTAYFFKILSVLHLPYFALAILASQVQMLQDRNNIAKAIAKQRMKQIPIQFSSNLLSVPKLSSFSLVLFKDHFITVQGHISLSAIK